jgi:hypothetical protein
MAALLIAQNGSENLFIDSSPGKLPRKLTEPFVVREIFGHLCRLPIPVPSDENAD